ncbi:MAG TPA: hypothetical protein VL793_03810 [Patescibacteria group bacterium]|nr:hypothetical protein [Patescibacteria group bacterium]
MKQIRIRLLTLAALFLATITSVSASPKSGIEGTAFLIISYGSFVEVEDGIFVGVPSIQMPIAASFTVFSRNGNHEVARVTTGANGVFSAALHPGKYLLVPDTLIFPWSCDVTGEPIEVTVNPKDSTLVNIFYFQDGPCTIAGVIEPNGP